MTKRGLALLVVLLVLLFATVPSVALNTGDVNGNGEVTAADASVILRYVVRLNGLTEEQLAAGDVNFDGATDSADAALILRLIVKLEEGFVSPIPTVAPNPDSDSLDIYLIDIGFGDSILIVSPNEKTMLIDSSNCGNNDHGVPAKTQMKNLFLELNIDSFDMGVYTHAHSDHVNGYLNFLFDDYTFDAFIGSGLINNPDSSTYKSITAKLQAQSFPTYYVTTESNTDKFDSWDSDVDIQVLWPEPDFVAYDTNDTSLVLKMSYAGYSIMLTGDATSNVEERLIQKYDANTLNCDIYKVAHHTSNGSSSSRFLTALSPDWAVASFTSNAYNWPGASTVERLRSAGLSWSLASNPNGRLFGTSYHGNIHISIDSDGITITSEYVG